MDLPLAVLQALRPKQWTKNVLLFAALIFSRKFNDIELIQQACWGFVAFSFLSSAGYIVNDARDKEADKLHPKKSKRPIASGRLPLKIAYVEAAIVFVLGCVIAWWVSQVVTPDSRSLLWMEDRRNVPWFLLVSLLYFATTMSYSLVFKNMVILDVMFIAAGFLWRATAGAIAIGVDISPWLLTCTAFLALFLGFNKRRGEVVLLAQEASNHRKNLAEYTPELIIEFQAITTSGTIISYALYTVLGSPTKWLLLTLPFVLYGVFRYMYLVSVKAEGGAPDETLYKDRPILVTCILYGLTAIGIMWGFAG